MNKFKRIISVILTASLFLLSFTSITFADGEAGFSENFTSMEEGSTPTGFDVLSGSGTISVKERESNKYVEIENDNDGSYVTLSRTFEELLGTVTAQTDFRQSGVKSDGNVIMQLLNGSTLVCSVETSGGNKIPTIKNNLMSAPPRHSFLNILLPKSIIKYNIRKLITP